MSSESAPRGDRVRLVLHSFDRGGSGRVAAYLARGFADQGVDVELWLFAKGGAAEAACTAIAGEGIAIRYFTRTTGSRPLDLLRGLPALVRLIRRDRPAVLVACANNVALITAIALRLSKVRTTRFCIKTTNPIASSRHRGLVRRIRHWSYELIFRSATAVWTLSPQESEEMRESFPRHRPLFRDVANPYVTPAMLAPPREQAPTGEAKTVITVARLTAQKRLERLISAFALVRRPNTRLLILGEGEERPALTALVASLRLDDRVAMPGYVTDVAAALHAADLFVLPSDYEGLPAVVLEAMAANCPVLSTDCFPAARALVGGTAGCAIIEDTGPAALAALIEAHLDQPKPTHLRAQAERFSIANGVRSHLEALASALEEHA